MPAFPLLAALRPNPNSSPPSASSLTVVAGRSHISFPSACEKCRLSGPSQPAEPQPAFSGPHVTLVDVRGDCAFPTCVFSPCPLWTPGPPGGTLGFLLPPAFLCTACPSVRSPPSPLPTLIPLFTPRCRWSVCYRGSLGPHTGDTAGQADTADCVLFLLYPRQVSSVRNA